MMKTVPRPIGVTILAILTAVGAAWFTTAGVIAAAGWMSWELGYLFLFLPIMLTAGYLAFFFAFNILVLAAGQVLFVPLLVWGVVGFAMARGLWRGRSWARWTLIMLSVSLMLGAVLAFLRDPRVVLRLGSGFEDLRAALGAGASTLGWMWLTLIVVVPFSVITPFIINGLFIIILTRTEAKGFFKAPIQVPTVVPYAAHTPPGGTHQVPLCPHCGRATTLYPTLGYFCHNCQKYV